jgi:hypothetical protein
VPSPPSVIMMKDSHCSPDLGIPSESENGERALGRLAADLTGSSASYKKLRGLSANAVRSIAIIAAAVAAYKIVAMHFATCPAFKSTEAAFIIECNTTAAPIERLFF